MQRLHLIGHPLNFVTFHLYIKCILHISFILVLLYWLYSNDLVLVFYKKLIKPPKSPLRLVNLNNTCPIRVTAASGTNLAGTFPNLHSLYSYWFQALHLTVLVKLLTSGVLLDRTFYALSNILYCCLSSSGTFTSPLWLIVR